eukprot:6667078-Prymnesium_polylepis.1
MDLAVSSPLLWQSPTAGCRWPQCAAQNEGPHISGLGPPFETGVPMGHSLAHGPCARIHEPSVP